MKNYAEHGKVTVRPTSSTVQRFSHFRKNMFDGTYVGPLSICTATVVPGTEDRRRLGVRTRLILFHSKRIRSLEWKRPVWNGNFQTFGKSHAMRA
jgi:hypothetical protein